MYKKIVVTILVVLILVCGLYELFGPKKAFSATENRYLASWPAFSWDSLLTGEYVEKIDEYLSDHFVGRDYFMSINTSYNRITLKDEVNGVYFANDYLIEKYDSIEKKNLIYKSINNFVQANPDVKVQVMLVPTSITINEDKLPANAPINSQLADLKAISDELECECIDVYEALMVANIEKNVFYHLDHHWTTYGAYAAYQKYCEVNGIEANFLSSYQVKIVANDFKGTIYNKVATNNMQGDVIERYVDDSGYTIYYGDEEVKSFYDDSYLKTNDKYGYFFASNHPIVTITNNASSNEEKLLIIKDSYANCFAPFVIEHYSSVTMIDPRYYGLSIADYIKTNNITKVLFLYNMNTIGNDVGIRGIE